MTDLEEIQKKAEEDGLEFVLIGGLAVIDVAELVRANHFPFVMLVG